jgi:uracil-DNA glycosylase family 4
VFGKLIGGKGNPESPLVIVGESPGKNELRLELPFVGPSGAVLDHALKPHSDITPLYINAVQCFPGSIKNKSQDRMTEATHCCQQRLHQIISLYPRKVILALGNPAIQSLTNNFGLKITQIRGKLFSVPNLAEVGIVAAVHPAFLLRGSGSLRQFVGDVDYACKLSKGGTIKRYVLPEVHIASNPLNVKWLADQIHTQSYVAADIETGGYQGFDFLRDHILCCGFCWDPNHVYVVPEHLIKFLGWIFTPHDSTRFIWHNGKFDQKFLWAANINHARVDEDTMLLSYALDETRGIHDLEQIASDLLGMPDWKFMVKEYTKSKKSTYADIPSPILHDYMARDVSGTLQVFNILRRQVQSDPLSELEYTKTLMPMSKYMARIEYRGMLPDLTQVNINKEAKQTIADALELQFNQIAEQAGFGPLNIRSPIQVSHLLYDVLKLRDPRRPNKRPESTDEDTLLTLPQDPIVKILLKYREVQKGLSTYVNSIPEHIGADSRIHTSYLIHGTTTGRPASRNPNVLNIPREPDLRNQFRASPGLIFMEIDVNQAELRVLAELSRDPELIYIYTTPGAPSIHKVTQTEMFGPPETYQSIDWDRFMEKFSTHNDKTRTLDEQNMRAKCVNFGIVYGRTAPSIAEEFRMPVDEAQEWINKWFRKYSVAREYILRCRQAPVQGKNLITPFGRKRRFQVVNKERLNDIQNQAANFPEQSIACDIVTHTGMRIQDEAYHTYGAHIVNTVYDSIIFELPNHDLNKVFELGTKTLTLLKKTAIDWGLTKIPFVGDIKLGDRWGSLKKTPIPDHIKQRTGVSV